MNDPLIDPGDLRGVRFPGSFRRYDARAVDEFLESVAKRVEATNDLVARLRAELGEKQQSPGASSAVTLLQDESETEPASPFDELAPEPEPQPQPAPAPAVVTPPEPPPELSTLSDDEVARLVGEETAHVLGAARTAASEIRSKAEESAARLIRESNTEAKQLTDDARAEADALVAEARTARDEAVREAEAEVAGLRSEAESTAEQIKADAEADVAAAVEQAETLRSEADAAATKLRSDAEAEAERILEDARTEGRSMLAEAKQVRARVLTDLQRRRDLAREQVDRLVSGRDRLLEAYAAVRANAEEMTASFDTAVVEAGEPVADIDEVIAAAVSDAEEAAADIRRDEVAVTDESDAESPGDEPADEVTADDAGVPADEAPGDDLAPVDADADAVDEAEPAVDDPWAQGPDDPDRVTSEAEAAGDADGDADQLFARIRAGRAESVARAQQILGDAGDTTSTDAELDAVGEVDAATAADSGDDTRGEDADAVPAELRADVDDYGRRDEVLTALDKKLSRAMKRKLADEQNQVLDTLRQTGSTAFDDVVPAEDDHVAAYSGVATKYLVSAAEAGAATSADGPDVDLGDLPDTLGRTLIEPFRRRIERAAADVDGDADTLDDRLRALYREWKVEHIGPAVTDALVAAYSAGQLAAAPGGAQLRWLIEPDAKACPDCHDNALAGTIAKGTMFPTEVAHPPAHPGCRCLLVVDT